MAFNGITLAAVLAEIRNRTENGRIVRIQQPEKYETDLVAKSGRNSCRIRLTADPALPMICLDQGTKQAPRTAPNFCMLLRKYIGNGKIISITQPGFERIADFEIQHLSEMGDTVSVHLIFELMGRQSNLILVGEDGRILDSIRKVPADISGSRLILPGQPYEMPPAQDKSDPLGMDRYLFDRRVLGRNGRIEKAFPAALTGFSGQTGAEIAARAGVTDRDISSLDTEEKDRVWNVFRALTEDIRKGNFSPSIFNDPAGKPADYSAFSSVRYPAAQQKAFPSMSEVLNTFYREREEDILVRQKTAELKKMLNRALARTTKKLELQQKEMQSTGDLEKYRIYGELLNTWGYQLKGGEDHLDCENFYDGTEIRIPLDPEKSVSENRKHFFDRYSKKKRTRGALTEMLQETEEELRYLRSVELSLSMAKTGEEIADVKNELLLSGEISREGSARLSGKNGRGQNKGKNQKKGTEAKSSPMHFISGDGYDIYVGKNNIQNDALTFTLASGGDIWFHAKKIPGSHVILKRKAGEGIPDRTYEEAARLAAHFSAAGGEEKVEVDYTERKNLKKPPHAKPGFVIYHTNYSMVAETDISGIRQG